MVYLGPIQPRPVSVKAPSRPTATTAVSAYANEHQKGDRSAGLDAVGPPLGVERRKQQDRRNKPGAAMLETRAGKDRRKSPQPSISVSI
ncbi:MAG: hypothetical protein Q7T48_14845 [Cellvibrio sp.]|uniref:hypothetical protein n=1 Tax=Cellvibrio sp. TaxID=1965322 RepID=UPI002715C2C0|nr:hypothetical protein [Cellvibrio sp.]